MARCITPAAGFQDRSCSFLLLPRHCFCSAADARKTVGCTLLMLRDMNKKDPGSCDRLLKEPSSCGTVSCESWMADDCGDR